MRKSQIILLFAATVAAALPGVAQIPGAADMTRVTAGNYKVESYHTQVAWSVNHLGFNLFYGLFGNATGMLTLDPAKPEASVVAIDFPVNNVITTSPALITFMKAPNFFDAAKFPVATFRSTKISVTGMAARIAGDLTIRGVSKPVVLDAHFTGAGVNPITKKATIGFEGTTSIKRSDFGLVTLLPSVGDQVDLHITAAFERVG